MGACRMIYSYFVADILLLPSLLHVHSSACLSSKDNLNTKHFWIFNRERESGRVNDMRSLDSFQLDCFSHFPTFHFHTFPLSDLPLRTKACASLAAFINFRLCKAIIYSLRTSIRKLCSTRGQMGVAGGKCWVVGGGREGDKSSKQCGRSRAKQEICNWIYVTKIFKYSNCWKYVQLRLTQCCTARK